MSVSTTGSTISYIANGTTTAFAFPYLFIAGTDLYVLFTDPVGVETPVGAALFTVTGAGSSTGGTVTFNTAPTSGTKVTIFRTTAETQETDYVFQDNFPAESHETALDKLTLQSQDRQRSIDRSVRVSESSPVLDPLSPGDRADRVVAFDDSGAIDLSLSTDALRTIIVANPVNQLANVTDYGTLSDINNYLLDYGTII